MADTTIDVPNGSQTLRQVAGIKKDKAVAEVSRVVHDISVITKTIRRNESDVRRSAVGNKAAEKLLDQLFDKNSKQAKIIDKALKGENVGLRGERELQKFISGLKESLKDSEIAVNLSFSDVTSSLSGLVKNESLSLKERREAFAKLQSIMESEVVPALSDEISGLKDEMDKAEEKGDDQHKELISEQLRIAESELRRSEKLISINAKTLNNTKQAAQGVDRFLSDARKDTTGILMKDTLETIVGSLGGDGKSGGRSFGDLRSKAYGSLKGGMLGQLAQSAGIFGISEILAAKESIDLLRGGEAGKERRREKKAAKKAARAGKPGRLGKLASGAGNLLKKGGGIIGGLGLSALSLGGSLFSGISSVGMGILSKAAPLLKGAARLGSKALLPLQAVLSIFDFASGFSDAAKIAGVDPKDLTMMDKVKSGISGMVSGLTFNMVDPETIFSGLTSLGSFFLGDDGFYGAVETLTKRASQLVFGVGDLGLEYLGIDFSFSDTIGKGFRSLFEGAGNLLLGDGTFYERATGLAEEVGAGVTSMFTSATDYIHDSIFNSPIPKKEFRNLFRKKADEGTDEALDDVNKASSNLSGSISDSSGRIVQGMSLSNGEDSGGSFFDKLFGKSDSSSSSSSSSSGGGSSSSGGGGGSPGTVTKAASFTTSSSSPGQTTSAGLPQSLANVGPAESDGMGGSKQVSSARIGNPKGRLSQIGQISSAEQSSIGSLGQAGQISLPTTGPASVNSPIGYRDTGIKGASKVHQGIDLQASQGSRINSIMPGKVLTASSGVNGAVAIQGPEGFIARHRHLQAMVKAGDKVTNGQQIGTVDTGGRFGPHQHLEVMKGGRFIDPRAFLKIAGRKFSSEGRKAVLSFPSVGPGGEFKGASVNHPNVGTNLPSLGAQSAGMSTKLSSVGGLASTGSTISIGGGKTSVPSKNINLEEYGYLMEVTELVG